ncbi:MAG TPA: DNA (cytosine-5-)-methyltransferase [Bacteroidetes bacterium]|nr:DNA (cytosine-5-)-methyltransferase [Bacteroidota bacterium]
MSLAVSGPSVAYQRHADLFGEKIKFIDLFAGMGGFRLGFERGFAREGIQTECVLTSEIKPHALKVLHKNFEHKNLVGDITKIDSRDIPDFDFLLAGFPCQPFSAGGKRLGFVDTRGTLFFEIQRILEEKQPQGFILENVEGLVKHDLKRKGDKIGRTLQTILDTLGEKGLGYKVSWMVLNSMDFGLPQSRKRIFIVGHKRFNIPLYDFKKKRVLLKEKLENGQELLDTKFTRLLLKKYNIKDLYGKSIKDKRGGDNNIHSWDLEVKGPVSKKQVLLLNDLFKQRRKKIWAKKIGIDWMDGMALTYKQIKTFNNSPDLKNMLEDLVAKGYLKFEHPKKLVKIKTENGLKQYREEDETKPKGYNIVTGKLSFEINKILDPNGIAPTLVATDVSRIAVPDGKGLRRLTVREGLRLLGFPEHFELPVKENEAFDLLGNSLAVPIVEAIAERLAEQVSILKKRQILSSVPV